MQIDADIYLCAVSVRLGFLADPDAVLDWWFNLEQEMGRISSLESRYVVGARRKE